MTNAHRVSPGRTVRLVIILGASLLLITALAVVFVFSTATTPKITLPSGSDIDVSVHNTGADRTDGAADPLAEVSKPMSNVYEITVSSEPAVAMITFHVDSDELAKAGPAADPSDFYLALDDENLGWIPLPSRWDARTHTVSALAPHLSRVSLRTLTGPIASTSRALSDAGSSLASSSEQLAQTMTDQAQAAARTAGGALAELGRAELNGTRIIGAYLESVAEGIKQSFTDEAFPEQESAGCDRKKDLTDVQTNVKYLQGCVLAGPPDQVSLANHGFLPISVGREGLTPVLDLSGDTDLAQLMLDLNSWGSGRSLITGHRARRLTMSPALQENQRWFATANPYVQAVFVDAIWSLLKVIPLGKRVETVTLPLRQQILAQVEQDGARSLSDVIASIVKVIERDPTGNGRDAVEGLKRLDDAFSCGVTLGEKFENSGSDATELADAVASAVRSCASTFFDEEKLSQKGQILSYVNSLLEMAPHVIHDGIGLYEGTQLTNVFASQLLVTQGSSSDDGDDPLAAANVWFAQGVQSVEHPVRQPSELVTTGDSSEWFTGMEWSSWSADSATGVGTRHLSCKASCSDSDGTATNGVQVLLDTPIQACGKSFYSRLTITDAGKRSTRTLLSAPVLRTVNPPTDCPAETSSAAASVDGTVTMSFDKDYNLDHGAPYPQARIAGARVGEVTPVETGLELASVNGARPLPANQPGTYAACQGLAWDDQVFPGAWKPRWRPIAPWSDLAAGRRICLQTVNSGLFMTLMTVRTAWNGHAITVDTKTWSCTARPMKSVIC